MAAGFAPVSIGTESDGSLVQPATRAGLYALRAIVGSIPGDGCLASAPIVATSGAMAKSVKGLADMLDVMMGTRGTSQLGASWNGLRVGVVDPEKWQPIPFVVQPNEDFKHQTVCFYNPL